MNRDEKRTRVQALPPVGHKLEGRTALFPSEPSGGTWIGVNDAGVSFALINWYSVGARVRGEAISRGELVRAALNVDMTPALDALLAAFPLAQTNPFRLVGVFPDQERLIEWRWNLSSLQHVHHPWRTHLWISSGYDESGAQRTRGDVFNRAMQGSRTCDVGWLRQLHSSHAPERGAYSICMHRTDAATVSYTELEVDRARARMLYLPHSPCCQFARGLARSRAGLRFSKVLRLQSPRPHDENTRPTLGPQLGC